MAGTATVPDVVGSTESQAGTTLQNAGLKVGKVNTISSTSVAAGKVVSANPAAGTVVTSGSAVNLEVSGGKTGMGNFSQSESTVAN